MVKPQPLSTRLNEGKLSFLNLLGESFGIFRSNFLLFLVIVGVVYIPYNVLYEISVSLLPGKPSEDLFGLLSSLKLLAYVQQILDALIGVIAFMAIAYSVERIVNGKTATWSEALKHSIGRWPHALIASILAGIPTWLGYICLVIPGIIIGVYLSFVIYAVALRGKSFLGALEYSKTIVSGNGGQVLLYGIGAGLLALLPAIPFAFLLVPVERFFSFSLFPVHVLFDTLYDLVSSVFVIFWVLLFLNLDYHNTKKAAASAAGTKTVSESPAAAPKAQRGYRLSIVAGFISVALFIIAILISVFYIVLPSILGLEQAVPWKAFLGIAIFLCITLSAIIAFLVIPLWFFKV